MTVTCGGGRTVVVGVKLESQSRELLTWALVKVAQPGDSVIAVHVLGNGGTVGGDGKSSLLSLVKTFDSILAVYDGFCNLKQVDLKLKICRGSSVRKILVQEAKSYAASEVIVGSSRSHHTICSSTSVAKYCAKKLPKDCGVIAVNNGKIVYHRECSPAAQKGSKYCEFCTTNAKGMKDYKPNSLLNVFHRTLSINHKVCEADASLLERLEHSLVKSSSVNQDTDKKQNCPACVSGSVLPHTSCKEPEDDSAKDNREERSLAIVPVKKAKIAPSSMSMLIGQSRGSKPGWPLLRHANFSDCRSASARRISVVQWALRLPDRHLAFGSISGIGQNNADHNKDKWSDLDGENGAIVPFGPGTLTTPMSPDNSKCLPKELQGLHEKYAAICRLFSYRELLVATSNFMAENLIGKGGSSRVYRGCLPDGKELAVKILKPSKDVVKEFILEIEIITTLHHENIIPLLGFCFEDNNLLLVYDLLSRGNLEENLHGDRKDPGAFGWNERYTVALGIAKALYFLHSGTAQPVIHRDVKSSNILLSDDFEPQLSDFGLALWASTSVSHITCTDVAGTFGYLAPEYFMHGKVNDKVDVYAFGVVLLELLTGRKPISNDYPKGQESLVMWAKPILDGGNFSQLLDPTLDKNYDHDHMERMVLAATLCIRRSHRARPQMSVVLKVLEGDAEVAKWARLQLNNASKESEMLDDENSPSPNIQSHLNLALLDVEDDSVSMSSIEQSVLLEDYLQGRWSRSTSFE